MGQADSLPNISRRLSACATSDGGRLMCTVNWLHEPGGYQLFCNRDEKLTRAAALPPRIRERDEIRYIAPVDGDFGGAWIGSNEFGVSICLLNGIGEPRGYRSRGLLIPDLLSAPSVIEVSRRVCQLYLSPFAAFTLAILEPGEQTTVIEWNGQAKKVVSAEMPLVSSSFDPASVRTIRCQEFARRLDAAGKLDSSVLLEFHSSHGRGPRRLLSLHAPSECADGQLQLDSRCRRSSRIFLHVGTALPIAAYPLMLVGAENTEWENGRFQSKAKSELLVSAHSRA